MNASNSMVRRPTLPSSMYYGLKHNPVPPADLAGKHAGGVNVSTHDPSTVDEATKAVALGGKKGAINPKTNPMIWLLLVIAVAWFLNKRDRKSSKKK